MGLVALGMFGFGYLLVPLYDVFCDITGLNGKTREMVEAEAATRFQPDATRTVTVQFVANNNQGMPWEFGPEVATMQVHPGQVYNTAFFAENIAAHDMIGQAVPSVAPGKASRFFNKTECFCFNNQPLAAGERKEMPLRFIIDPSLPERIETITLAYTFFDISEQVTQ